MKHHQMNHKQRIKTEFITVLQDQGVSLAEAKKTGYKDDRVLYAIGFCLATYPVSFHRDDISDFMCRTLTEEMARKAKETYFMNSSKKAA